MLEPSRGFTDVGQLLRQLGRVVNSVCQISYPLPGGITYGTGFLIGDSTVLTNWHVVEHVNAGNRQDVSLRFDFRTGPDGSTVSPGVEYKLVDSESDWLIDHSAYDPLDKAIRTIDEERALDRSLENLDFAVLRVAGEPGKNPIGANTSQNAELRGCLSLSEAIDVPTDSELGIWCFQHPYENGQSLPQQVDWNKGILSGSSNKSRVWYDINTRPGSSGSPILTNKLQLCALHHAGGKDWPAPGQYLYNRGIPLVTIRELLTKRGKLGEIN